MPTLRFFVTACAIAILSGVIGTNVALAQTEAILHSFGQIKITNDGSQPDSSPIAGADGNLYGTTYIGGSASVGTIYKLTPTGVITILHSFQDGSVTNDGSYPRARLLLAADGNFYGTTTAGGSNNSGTIYKITPAGVYTQIHQFADGSVVNDAAYPYAGLIQGSDGNFYGTSQYGGASSSGTVYSMSTVGVVTILHSLAGGNDGISPLAELVEGSTGVFYGTAETGGSANYGIAFKITSAGTYTALHQFTDGSVTSDGAYPNAPFTLVGGSLYTTTQAGGAGTGVVLKMSLTGSITILHLFGDGTTVNDGSLPQFGLTLATDGSLYGTTPSGGSVGNGSLFKITTAGVYTFLHGFNDPAVSHDGTSPYGSVIQLANGNFYGATYQGGTANQGTVYQLTLAGAYSVIRNFQETLVPNDGTNPYTPVTLATDGNIYGTTTNGGSQNQGTVFKMTTAGTTTILHHFSDGSVSNDGGFPYAGLTQGTDGNFYGMTQDSGGIFKITPAGVMTVLHVFGSITNDGYNPNAKLIQATDGNFYGTTTLGGANGYGTVFKMTPAGTVTILHSFSTSHSDGAEPMAALVQGIDGSLYGTTRNGGAVNSGTTYKISLTGTFSLLHSFTSASSGTYSPLGSLVQGTDGNFYGTTASGGTAGGGTVFQMTSTGTTTILHTFGDGSVTSDGTSPQSGLIQVTDGNFCGTTMTGGTYGIGTVYEITSAGVVTILHDFGDTSVPHDGSTPDADLREDSLGTLYGTTTIGGLANLGTAFQVTKPAQTLTFPTIANHYVNDAAFGVMASASSTLPVVLTVVSGPATISGGTVTLSGTPGTVVIKATQVGSPVVAPITGTQSFSVTLVPQTITFGALSDHYVNDAAFTVAATASSGLPPTFTVTGPATISGSTITLTGATGLVSVSANQSGNTTYAVAPTVVQTFNVNLMPQSITFGSIATQQVGNTVTLAATASSGLSVTYGVTGPASISSGILTVTGTGSVTVTASQTGNATYAVATPVPVTFTATKGSQTITFGTVGDQPYGVRYTLNATASSGQSVTYSVTSGPATLSGRQLTFTGLGAVTVKASQGGNSTYLAASDVSQTFNVIKGSQTISFPGVAKQTWPVSSVTLNATASSGLAITYAVAGSGATISGNTVHITMPGTVNVTARQSGGTNYNAATQVTIQFNVAKTPQTITFASIPTHVYGDSSFTLSATSSSGLAVTYTASGAATISGNTVTITGAGTAKITASQVGDTYNAKALSVAKSFSISKAPQTITFPTIPDKTVGAPAFAISATSSSGLGVTLSIFSGPATISGNMVTVTGKGTVKVKAVQNGNTNYNAAPTILQSFMVTP